VSATTDELCPTCGAPLTRQTDKRRAAGFSLRCSVGGHARPATAPRRGKGGKGGKGDGRRVTAEVVQVGPLTGKKLIRLSKPKRGTRPVMANPAPGARAFYYFQD
jgi:hypothetical protein